MLANTVAHMRRDLDVLLDENHALKSTTAPQVIQAPRRAALTTTEVPRFDGTASWEQYHQVSESIVRSNGWDNDTAALQLFSHLEGDALNVAHLVSTIGATADTSRISGCINGPLWFSGLISGLWKTVRTSGDGELEILAVKAFGDMGQTA